MKPQNPPPKAPDAPKSEEDLPLVTSFGLHRKSTRWTAVALQTQGMRVLKVRVLEADPDKSHVEFVLARVQHEWLHYGQSPFDPEVAA
jgi:hypothetical protein